MDYFASWYHGDLWLPDYDPDCRMLISVTSVSQFWRLKHYKKLPHSLIIDSGGFRYANHPHERPIPKQVLAKQISMISGTDLNIYLCTLDYPIFDSALSSNEKDRCITQTIAYAYEMKAQFEQLRLKPHIQPMAIIQGYNVDSLKFCAHELKSIGFSKFGLGSLLGVRQNEPELVRRVAAVIDQVGNNLHIFGITGMSTVRQLRQLGVASFDSARAAKSAAYNELFFYNHKKLSIIRDVDNNSLYIPIPSKLKGYDCECPICKGRLNPVVTMKGKRQHNALRAVHNYWHLKMALSDF